MASPHAGSQTIQYFLPALMANLGYNSIDAQYMTIPVVCASLLPATAVECSRTEYRGLLIFSTWSLPSSFLPAAS